MLVMINNNDLAAVIVGLFECRDPNLLTKGMAFRLVKISAGG